MDTAKRRGSAYEPLTRDELLELPASVPLWPTAGQAVNLGRTKTFQLAKDGQFPVQVLRLGASYRVRTADLLAYLGIEPAPAAASKGAPVA